MGLNGLLLLGSALILMLFTGFALMQKSVQLVNALKKKDTTYKRTIVTVLIGFFAFSTLGVFVMYGLTSWSGQGDGLPRLFLIFQSLLCVSTIIIATAASYGRLPGRIYIFLALFISVFIYPFLGRLLWQDALGVLPMSWLADMGFRDIAGATLIHSVAGWVALATLIMFGLRKKAGAGLRYKLGTRILSTVLISGGIIAIIAVMASLHVSDFSRVFAEDTVRTALSNALFAAFSSLAVAVLTSLVRFRRLHVWICTSAFVAGLVAISGAAFTVDAGSAIIIGAVASVLMMVTARVLAVLNISDALNIVPTHLVAGIWGSIAVGLFANTELLGSQLQLSEQLAIQIMGVTFYGLFSFLPTCVFLWLLAKLNLLGIDNKKEEALRAKKASTLFSTLEEEARARKTTGYGTSTTSTGYRETKYIENVKATQALSILTSYDSTNSISSGTEETNSTNHSTVSRTSSAVNDTGTGLRRTDPKVTQNKATNGVTTSSRLTPPLAAIAQQQYGLSKRYPSEEVQLYIELLEDGIKATKPANYTTSLVLSKLSSLRTSSYENELHKEQSDKAKDSDIFGVQLFCTALADTLSHAEHLEGQITAQFVNDIYFASALHRIATISVDEELLFDAGNFDGQDYSDFEAQSSLSLALVEDISSKAKNKIKSQGLLHMFTDITRAHLERWDGKGQPNGLGAEDIPLAARIISLVDGYIALRQRPSTDLSHPKASQYILMNSMKRFDPIIVHHFFRINEFFEKSYTENFSYLNKNRYTPPTVERIASQALTNGKGEVIEPTNTMELLMDL